MIGLNPTPKIYSFVREREIDYAEGEYNTLYQQALNSKTELLEELNNIRKEGVSFARNYVAMRERFAVDGVVVSVHSKVTIAQNKISYLVSIDVLDSLGLRKPPVVRSLEESYGEEFSVREIKPGAIFETEQF